MACARLRDKYKEIQSLPKYSIKNIEILKERLATLKAGLELEATLDQIANWSTTMASLKELEELPARLIRILSCAKGIREYNEPIDFYFAILQAKL